MPAGGYVIINDKDDSPTHYYKGTGWRVGEDTALEEAHAEVYTLNTATAVMHRRADLYAAGWRIVPSARSPK